MVSSSTKRVTRPSSSDSGGRYSSSLFYDETEKGQMVGVMP